jgi:hypothetical protein
VEAGTVKPATQTAQITILQDLGEVLWEKFEWYTAVVIGRKDIPHLRVLGFPFEITSPVGVFDVWEVGERGNCVAGELSMDGVVAWIQAHKP